jgi:O-antigen/teichoic acid export membrane protein
MLRDRKPCWFIPPQSTKGTIKRQLLFATGASIGLALALFLLSIILARKMGPEEFGVYGLFKGITNFLEPILLLPVGLSLVQNVTKNPIDSDKKILINLSILYILACSFGIYAATVFLGNNIFLFADQKTVYSFGFYLVAYAAFVLAYNITRSFLQIERSSAMLFLGLGGFPLIAAISSKKISSAEFLFISGLILFVVALPVILSQIKNMLIKVNKKHLLQFQNVIKEGAPRSMYSMSYQAQFMAGPCLLSLNGYLKEAGFFVIAQNIPKICESLTEGLFRAGVPLLSKKTYANKKDQLRQSFSELLILVPWLGIFIMNLLIINTDLFIYFLYGNLFLEANIYLQIISLALPFFLFYSINKILLETHPQKYLNLVCSLAGVGCFFGIYSILYFILKKPLPNALVFSFTIGLVVLGLTSAFLNRHEKHFLISKKEIIYYIAYYTFGVLILINPFQMSSLCSDFIFQKFTLNLANVVVLSLILAKKKFKNLIL